MDATIGVHDLQQTHTSSTCKCFCFPPVKKKKAGHRCLVFQQIALLQTYIQHFQPDRDFTLLARAAEETVQHDNVELCIPDSQSSSDALLSKLTDEALATCLQDHLASPVEGEDSLMPQKSIYADETTALNITRAWEAIQHEQLDFTDALVHDMPSAMSTLFGPFARRLETGAC